MYIFVRKVPIVVSVQTEKHCYHPQHLCKTLWPLHKVSEISERFQSRKYGSFRGTGDVFEGTT